MRFVLIDRIVDVQTGRCRLSGAEKLTTPGPSLVAIKNLSLAEEYLSDHFPGFPVMPGVLDAGSTYAGWGVAHSRHGGFCSQYHHFEKSSDDQV